MGFERGRDVVRNFAGRHQNRIKPNIAECLVGVGSEPNLRCGCNAPALPLVDGFGRLIECGARFYFGEDQKLAPARDDVDFTEWTSPASRQNAESLPDQQCSTPPLGP